MQGTSNITKKAIYYRAHHRGTKEADWVIGGFVREHLDGFSADQISVLKQLVDLDDESFLKQVENPDPEFAGVIEVFRAYKAGL